jgi:amidase
MDDDLCLLPAVELARLLRSRELSARELLEASLTRIDEVDPVIGAVVSRDVEGARRRAAELDEAIVRSGPVGLLHGLPTAHKDLLDTAGLPTTFGSLVHAGNVPAADSVLAARVRAAGAVRVGKTNVPEFGAGSQTHNRLFGTTRNPYDPSRTPGGSSGGAAAALATGMVAVADGSDMGGSLRNPASFCNVVGLRPTPGRVPHVPARDPWFDLSVVGPMGRRAADVALQLVVTAGPDPRDPYAGWPQLPQRVPDLDRDLRGVRAAWGGSLGLPFEPEVLAAHAGARPGVEQTGLLLTEAEPSVRGADEVFRTLRGWHMATTIGDTVERAGDTVAPMVRENVAYGRTVTAEQLARALHRRSALLRSAVSFFDRHDYLFLPVSQVLPFDAGVPWVREIAGEAMPDYLGWMRSSYLVSVLRTPAASVPLGFTASGLPVGLQVVGRPGDDLGVLQVAHALEQVFRAGERPPDLAALRRASASGAASG